MKNLHVPLQNVSLYETALDKMKILLEAGAVAEVDQVNWEEDFPVKMPVTVRVAHNNESLYLYFTVIGEELRAYNTDDFGSVWEDSCVEFFMQREGETDYRNFECNVLGALLSRVHKSRDKGESQTELMSSIIRHSTINHRYENGKQVSDWSMYLEIPKEAMGFKKKESLSGQKIRANFYKCGDKTPNPHYLSWSPIDLPEPNFHTPKFFGELEFE
ncbi:MAG: carbohydrate-binding family 9-like protein [Fermentimonas sp.]|nr:carbohydrate-binding family 9-like protein [Fermentimonas sp.]